MLLSKGPRLLLRPRAPWSSAALQQQGSSRRAFLATAASTPVTADARGAPPSSYAAVTEEDMKAFERILSTEGGGGGKLLRPSPSEPSSLEAYTSDWTRKWSASGCPAVLQPRSTEQVSALLRHCNARRIAVVPQGGNTGLVGGSIPVRDEVVLSLARMKGVLGFDAVSGILTCEAGCVLEELDTWLRERGFVMPLDLGAKGSCQIGGNVSTNAGGLRYLRYGSLHGTVLGLEVVLADGTVLDLLSTLRKDNTGLDLKHLFIGSEGTLGIVTKVAIHVPPAPKAVNVALVGLESFARVQEMVVLAKRSLGEVLSAMELIDVHSLHLVLRKRAWGLRNPLGGSYPFYMLLETSGSDEAHDVAKLEQLLEEAVEGAVVADGAIAQDLAQARDMWRLRELIPVAIEEEGRVHKYDVSVPLPVFYDIVAETRQRLASRPSVQVVGYGHLGDSNLHLNIAVPRGEPDPTEAIDAVLPWVMAHKGSVSAEHGLGQVKAKYLPMTKSPAVYQLMVAQKRLLDPHGILNPYKYYGGMEQQQGKA